MQRQQKLESIHYIAAVENEMREADAAMGEAQAEIRIANKSGAKAALTKAFQHFNAGIEILSAQSDLDEVANSLLAQIYYWRARTTGILNEIDPDSVNMDEAIADLVKSTELKPDAKTYLRMGKIYAQQGNEDAAMENIKKAILHDFNSVAEHLLKTFASQESGEAEDDSEDAGEPIVF